MPGLTDFYKIIHICQDAFRCLYVNELLMNHGKVCTSRDFKNATDKHKMCHMVVSALLQKVRKKHTASTKTGLTQKMTENTTPHLPPYIWVVNKHYVHTKRTHFFRTEPSPPFMNILFSIIQYEWRPHSIYTRERSRIC